MDSYWTKFTLARMTRRRALVGTGAAAAAAAFLVACGGSSNNSSGGTSGGDKTSSLITPYSDSLSSAKAGGAVKWMTSAEPLHFDGQSQGQVQLNFFNGFAYESLVRNKPGIGEASTYTEVLPNLAESFEFSPDRLQITFKLRQGVKWQNIAPVNGRLFDSSDVVASFNRYKGLPGNNRSVNVNEFNPDAPVVSVTAPDAKTVVYKLKEPASYIMQRIANMITGELGSVYPKEADQGFDPRKGQIGTGAYILDKYEPSVSLNYRKNPDYWNKDTIYPDSIEMPLLNQYAAQLAQLQTGAIYSIPTTGFPNPGTLSQDVLTVKKEVPAINMYSYVPASNNPSEAFRFGWNDLNGKKSPFLDVRVRQAISLSFDRDAFIDTFSNVSKFQDAGLPMDTYYFTSIGYIPGITLDPRSKDFGENAKYLTRDLTQAKQLLSAAGYANGFDYQSHQVNGIFGAGYSREVEVMDSFVREIGLKPQADPIDYNLKYLPNYVTQRGKFEGVLYGIGAVTSPDPVDYYIWRAYSKSGPTSGALGFDVNGTGDGSGDPQVDAYIDKAKAEGDPKKVASLLGDLQRYMAKQCYCVLRPGVATTFDLAWPALRNYLVYQEDSRSINSSYYTWWLDPTQQPIKKT